MMSMDSYYAQELNVIGQYIVVCNANIRFPCEFGKNSITLRY